MQNENPQENLDHKDADQQISPSLPNSFEVSDEEMDALETSQVGEDGLIHTRVEIKRLRSNRRLDKYLSQRFSKDTSRNAIQNYIKEGTIRVNDLVVKRSFKLSEGDIIDMALPPAKKREIPAEDIPLDIIYEDDDMMAINKQADLIVHPARGNWSGTLVNALAYYFKMNWRRDISELPVNGEVFRPGIVHRLDRDTTGVILIAKTELALWKLGQQFENRTTQKTYNAIVHGHIGFDEDVINMPIGKHAKYRERYAVHRDTGKEHPIQTKEAITRYKVLDRLATKESNLKFTLVELFPKTGRTHQLRVHMSSIKHPMIGDRTYGGGPLYSSQLDGNAEVAEGPIITRQALHARSIEFDHPRTGERMRLEAPLPPDFVQAIEEIRSRS